MDTMAGRNIIALTTERFRESARCARQRALQVGGQVDKPESIQTASQHEQEPTDYRHTLRPSLL
jgi:hypothetical protein